MIEITIEEYNNALERLEILKKELLNVHFEAHMSKDLNLEELEIRRDKIKKEYAKYLLIKMSYENKKEVINL